mgnify:FL=1
MGILSTLDAKIKRAEERYAEIKKDTQNIRRVGDKVFDVITLAPTKKGGKPIQVKVKKCPPCPCSRIKKSDPKYKKKRR